MGTLRKFLYGSDTTGVPTEQALDDLAQFAKVSCTGDGGISFDGGGQRAYNFSDPSDDTDLATKQYVDAVASGLKLKEACRAIEVSSNVSLSGLTTIDGVSLADGDRVLLTAQSTGAQNGIWIVRTGSWDRPEDYDTGDNAASSFTFVQEGGTYADTGWVCTTDPPNDVIDTHTTAWTQFSGAGSIVAGAGLDKSGNTIFIGNGAGIQVNADSVEVELATPAGLEFHAAGVTGQLRVKVGTTRRGLQIDTNGLYISLATNSGLTTTTEDLEVLLNATGGIQKDANGLAVKLDESPDTLDVGANGLKVVGVPLSFKINGVAVSASFTAGNATSLVDGSTITTLHNHKNAVRVADTYQAEETVAAGDPVAWGGAADDTFVKGDPTNNDDSHIIGVAESAISSGSSGLIVKHGICEGILGGGATRGDTYFLAVGGGLTTTPPVGGGRNVVQIGYAKNANDLDVIIQRLIIRS